LGHGCLRSDALLRQTGRKAKGGRRRLTPRARSLPTLRQQKLADIAMAFMSEPALVLLDEPCSGVNPSLVGGISRLLKQLNQERQSSFVVIEHNMEFVMGLCHRIMVMVEGQVLAIGTPDEIRANKQVLDAYLGN
jgi:branched-chain amino acid transport system ATP-binding protein